jgi:hypothetical protein
MVMIATSTLLRMARQTPSTPKKNAIVSGANTVGRNDFGQELMTSLPPKALTARK